MLNPIERDRTIVEHYKLVQIIASRMVQRFPGHVEKAELINTGMLGLIDAVDRFDPARGVPFKAYAEIRIRGAIVDALRESDWIPRGVRRSFARIDTARRDLRQQLGREPAREEMARHLEVTPEQYDDLCDGAQIRRLVSLDAPTTEDGDGSLLDEVSDDDESVLERLTSAETRGAVARAIQHLPEKERAVVTLYYLRGLSLKEIGGTLGVTESRASQLRRQAVERLQTKLRVATPRAGPPPNQDAS
jgi:RNA polymerase sigma factor for flagellar operon FliA